VTEKTKTIDKVTYGQANFCNTNAKKKHFCFKILLEIIGVGGEKMLLDID